MGLLGAVGAAPQPPKRSVLPLCDGKENQIGPPHLRAQRAKAVAEAADELKRQGKAWETEKKAMQVDLAEARKAVEGSERQAQLLDSEVRKLRQARTEAEAEVRSLRRQKEHDDRQQRGLHKELEGNEANRTSQRGWLAKVNALESALRSGRTREVFMLEERQRMLSKLENSAAAEAQVEQLRAGHRQLRWQLRRAERRAIADRAAHDAHVASMDGAWLATATVLGRQLAQAWDAITADRKNADEERALLLSELAHAREEQQSAQSAAASTCSEHLAVIEELRIESQLMESALRDEQRHAEHTVAALRLELEAAHHRGDVLRVERCAAVRELQEKCDEVSVLQARLEDVELDVELAQAHAERTAEQHSSELYALQAGHKGKEVEREKAHEELLRTLLKKHEAELSAREQAERADAEAQIAAVEAARSQELHELRQEMDSKLASKQEEIERLSLSSDALRDAVEKNIQRATAAENATSASKLTYEKNTLDMQSARDALATTQEELAELQVRQR